MPQLDIIAGAKCGMDFLKGRTFHKFRNVNDTSNEEAVSGKVVVITGANSGIGKVLALQMAKRGAVVVMACRNLQKAKDAISEIQAEVPNANLHLVKIDLADMNSVVACAKKIKEKFLAIKILVNNAGYMNSTSDIERTEEGGFEKHLATNYLGHYLLTLHLLGSLRNGAPSRIVTVGSTAHVTAKLQTDDLNMQKKKYKGHLNFGPYMNAKRCSMLFSKELARRLEGTQVRTYSLCPGIVGTGLFAEFPGWLKLQANITNFFVGSSPEQGTETLVYCSLSKECAHESGQAYRFAQIWNTTPEILNDRVLGKELWKETENLLGIKSREFGI